MNKTILITGGSSGIGLALCKFYLDEGYTVISLSRQKINIPNDNLKQYSVDLSDAIATKKIMESIVNNYDVAYFIHNAGVILPNLIDDVSLDELNTLTQIHLGSAIQITQQLLPKMRVKKFGRIVFVSSRGALGLQTRTAYSATKAGMIGMARTWALELAAEGITVNVVAPGPIKTPMFNNVIDEGSEREIQISQSIPVKRLGDADDVVRAIEFFASPKNSFITGQTLYVCGGASIGTITI